MAKVKNFLSRLNNRQSFIVIMTLILGFLAFVFTYPEHAPEFIKGLALLGFS